jgi:chromosome segregation ATPase
MRMTKYFIGHAGSTFWRKKDSEKAEIFYKVEPYLTFLNIHQLERQGADIQTKVEELEELNQSLRQRDKVKDDAIAQLSDQLVSLSARLQEIERRQMLVRPISCVKQKHSRLQWCTPANKICC